MNSVPAWTTTCYLILPKTCEQTLMCKIGLTDLMSANLQQKMSCKWTCEPVQAGHLCCAAAIRYYIYSTYINTSALNQPHLSHSAKISYFYSYVYFLYAWQFTLNWAHCYRSHTHVLGMLMMRISCLSMQHNIYKIICYFNTDNNSYLLRSWHALSAIRRIAGHRLGLATRQ